METPIFKLFANCIPVKGARRAVLCDLQRGRTKLIPHGLYEVLTEHRDQSPAAIKAAYGGEFDAQIDGYFEFLIGSEWGFWCTNPALFPDLPSQHQAPSAIHNAIIDFDAESEHQLAGIVPQLDALGCRHLQVRVFHPISLAEIEHILCSARGSKLRSTELLAPYHDGLDHAQLAAMCRKYPRLHRLVLHGAPEYRQETTNPDVEFLGLIMYYPETLTSHHHCGVVDRMYFQAELYRFLEAKSHNTCLNGKISVDVRGEIRNCPSLPESFGSLATTTLATALASKGFKHFWKMGKDQIEVCQDCEFRYICSDCRAFLSDPANPKSKPGKCGYNPYTAAWEQPAVTAGWVV